MGRHVSWVERRDGAHRVVACDCGDVWWTMQIGTWKSGGNAAVSLKGLDPGRGRADDDRAGYGVRAHDRRSSRFTGSTVGLYYTSESETRDEQF
jgi:hypothetical protein